MPRQYLVWVYSNLKQKYTTLQIISFDSSDLESILYLQYSAEAVVGCIQNKEHAIIVCGSFASSHTEILKLADNAVSVPYEETQKGLYALIEKHITALQHIVKLYKADELTSTSKETQTQKVNSSPSRSHSDYYDSIISQIHTISQHAQSLLKGISYIKEISTKTSKLLNSYTSSLAALLIQANIYFACKQLFVIVDSIDTIAFPSTNDTTSARRSANNTTNNKVRNNNGYYILSSLNTGSNSNEQAQDYIAAQLAVTHKAKRLNIWTHHRGIMTANPKIIPHAKPIEFVEFTLALEIAYLGGKLLHPTAVHMLLEHNIPICIYSYNNPQKVASTIASTHPSPQCPQTHIQGLPNSTHSTDSHHKTMSTTSTTTNCLTITDRDNFTMLSIRSTNMFERFGYLEKIFCIFNTHKVPVETLTTSEISITLTFPMQYCSEALLQDSKTLGEVEHMHNQSIISLVGNYHWKSSSHIAELFTSISEKIPIHMLSLGKSASNLSIVINSADKKSILKELHRHFFEQ